MKKFFLLAMASMMTVFAMAIGSNDGSTKANAIDFDWDKGVDHPGGTLWYRVGLDSLYSAENPSLTLYLTNPSNEVGTSVDVSMKATVAGQTESKDYSIAARQYKTYTANASMLVRMRQTEIYLTLTSNGRLKLSAKVFESADLDETCKDARTLAWNTVATQNPSYSAWWKVSLKPVKEAADQDAKITITNTGSKTVNLRVGQSLDCPSSGLTKRDYVIAPNESVVNTVPRSMITSVQPDELYFGIENVESQVSIKVEPAKQPDVPVITPLDPYTVLHVTDTIEPLPEKRLYRIKVADMDSMSKFEPEFTYRNVGLLPAKVTVQMAFELPAFSTSNTVYELAPGQEEIVVYKKNMLEGMGDVEYIYLLTSVEGGQVNFYGRFKHVREGKACKTNIDFEFDKVQNQEARTTQWYAVDVTEARDNFMDIVAHVENDGNANAKVTASLAFSCPYIDLQEVTRTIEVGGSLSHTLGYSTYAMMTDTVWIGIETSQNIHFWATTKPTKINEPDDACLKAVKFDWDEGVRQNANDTVWYKVAMDEAREKSAKFPTVFVQNMSGSEPAKIKAELSLECPDSIANQSRSLTIEANGSFSKQLSRNLFENISQDTIYIRVISTQEISLQIRLTEESEGSSCSSAIPFNWVSGNTQEANADLWYIIDLRDVMKSSDDVKVTIENRDNAPCKGVADLSYACPVETAPTSQNFKLAAKESQSIKLLNSTFETLVDSFVYINLSGNTSLHFEAIRIPQTTPFDTIYENEVTALPLYWNTRYTQTVDTAWYVISSEELAKVRNSENLLTPVAHLFNLAGAENTVKAEVAYAFPIVKKMMAKSKTLKANQHYFDTIPASTFEQVLQKNQIILRVTRKAGAGDFEFEADTINSNNGNDAYTAIPVMMGQVIEQEANTEMWYKVKVADWKKDQTLHGKSLHIDTKNLGNAKSKLHIEIYDGLKGVKAGYDLLEGRGDSTVRVGESFSHNIPAYLAYGLNTNAEIYIKARVSQHMIFQSEFSNYATAPADPDQQKAKLLVPNVDYIIPADTTLWYEACFPYILKNYKLTDASNIQFRNMSNKAAKITVSAAFQDTITYDIPVRTRTVSGNRSAQKTFKELVDKAFVKAGINFSIQETEDAYLDSMIRRFVADTSEHISAKFRVHTTEPLFIRVNLPQVVGNDNDCMNPMEFDWKHGVVNPAGQLTWYRVTLDKSMIPDTCDVRLHVENWSDIATATGKADLFFTVDEGGVKNCDKTPDLSITKTVAPQDEEWKDIDRDWLENMGWPSSLFIKYHSDQTTYVWLELIPKKERQKVETNQTLYLCDGEVYTDTLMHVDHLIDASDVASLQWNDTVEKKNQKEAYMYDSIIHVTVVPVVDPQLYPIEAVPDQPVIERGKVLDVTGTTAWLKAAYNADHTADPSLKRIDTLIWRYSEDGQEYVELPTTPLYKERINLKYLLVTQCEEDTLEVLFKNVVRDTLEIKDCKPYEWEGHSYTTDTLDSVIYHHTYLGDSIPYLKLTILDPVKGKDSVVACNSFVWEKGDGKEYINDTIVYYTYAGGAESGCDSIVEMKITVKNPLKKSLQLVAKFGDRLLMINRNEINELGWKLDSLDNGMGYVKWYKEATPADVEVGTGYYYNLPTGDPLPEGDVYYATIEIPQAGGCGLKGETNHYQIGAKASAPALVPSLAQPGQNIQVVNLNPNVETRIRIYTTEGLLQKEYLVSGEESFNLKAAYDHGFYLVELSNEEMKSTLRYIVK